MQGLVRAKISTSWALTAYIKGAQYSCYRAHRHSSKAKTLPPKTNFGASIVWKFLRTGVWIKCWIIISIDFNLILTWFQCPSNWFWLEFNLLSMDADLILIYFQLILSWFQFTFNWFEFDFNFLSIHFDLGSNYFQLILNWFQFTFNCLQLISLDFKLQSFDFLLLSIHFKSIFNWFQFSFTWFHILSTCFQVISMYIPLNFNWFQCTFDWSSNDFNLF